MELPLAALSEGPDCPVRVSRPVAGKTLTSAPVSTRNRRPECVSETNKRPSLRPVAEATMGDRPARFPTKCKGPCIAGRLLRTCDDSSRARRSSHRETGV